MEKLDREWTMWLFLGKRLFPRVGALADVEETNEDTLVYARS